MKILDAARGAIRIVFVIFDAKALGGEEALLDGDSPGAVVGVAVALQAYGSAHVGSLTWQVNRQRKEGRQVRQSENTLDNRPGSVQRDPNFIARKHRRAAA